MCSAVWFYTLCAFLSVMCSSVTAKFKCNFFPPKKGDITCKHNKISTCYVLTNFLLTQADASLFTKVHDTSELLTDLKNRGPSSHLQSVFHDLANPTSNFTQQGKILFQAISQPITHWKGYSFSCALPNLHSASHTYDSVLGLGQVTSSFSLSVSSSLKQGNNTFSSVGALIS